jgi:hypothetical protein
MKVFHSQFSQQLPHRTRASGSSRSVSGLRDPRMILRDLSKLAHLCLRHLHRAGDQEILQAGALHRLGKNFVAKPARAAGRGRRNARAGAGPMSVAPLSAAPRAAQDDLPPKIRPSASKIP